MAEGIDYPETRACILISLKEGQFVAKFRYLGENRPAKIPSKKDQIICGAKEMVAGVC